MVVMPAYNAEVTLETTWKSLPHDIVDRVLLVDDFSKDRTISVAQKLGIDTLTHPRNMGYGANQKTCYHAALEDGADIIVMLHSDYQYEPKLVTAMAAMIESEVYEVVIGSRILGGKTTQNGMPIWKYVANRILTAIENMLLGAKLSEYHSGYRAYSAQFLQKIEWQHNSNTFVFDNQLLAQAILKGYTIGEISIPTKYFPTASSISLINSIKYGFGVLAVSILGFLTRSGLYTHSLFKSSEPKEKG